MSYKDELKKEVLVGKKVLSAKINAEKDMVVLETDSGTYYLSWDGECCSKCFIQHFNGADYLIGSTIASVEHSQWTTLKDNDDFNVLESMGTKIKTDKGYVDIETRLSHNGYYSGEIKISTVAPLDTYNGARDIPELKPLQDF